MKSLLDPLHLGAILVVAALAGCGQKGPLYLPAKPVPMQTPAPVPAAQTAPAPAGSAAPVSK
ncbi:MAG TPA: lipoprotein [Noviherbaspirillum sp.]|nr:lipoprotein [Noviherbaspirillum sp.]